MTQKVNEGIGMTRYIRNADIVGTRVEDEVILMSIESGMFYTLTGPMAEIWLLLESEKSLKELVAALMAVFDIEQAACEVECSGLLQEMLGQKIISTS